MGDGFLLVYKRFEAGSLSWPRTTAEAADIAKMGLTDQPDSVILIIPRADPLSRADAHPAVSAKRFLKKHYDYYYSVK